MSLSITGIILAKNEEKHIVQCIKSINFCDEILIIDDHSTDGAIETINELNDKKIKVISHSLDNDFSQARNFGISKANGRWILFLDADERASEALAFEISNVISNWIHRIGDEPNGFYIHRIDFMWGKELRYGESGIKLLRLAKKDAGNWVGKVHEEWKIKGKLGILKNPIIHYPHQSVAEFLREVNFYTDVRVTELCAKNIKVYWWSIIAYPINKFIVDYFLKRGFLDGINGLTFALIMSFHSFLVRSKLWLKKEEK